MTEETASKRAGLSIPQLRNIILLCLAVGTAAFTAVMFSLAGTLSEKFGPQVLHDLEWKVVRGAIELSKACELAVAIGDVDEIRGCFGVYGTSSDVQALVVTGSEGAELVRKGTVGEGLDRLFSGAPGVVRRESGHLVSWAAVEIEGSPLGKIAVVVSTDRLSEAQSLLNKSSNATLLGGLAALVFGSVVVIFFTRTVANRDAQLQDYAANLERKVEVRTLELDARNRGMRLVLDNVAQGFITIDYDGVMASERSAIVDTWFGTPAEEAKISDYLEPASPNTGLWIDIGLEQLRDDLMPADLIIEQMPSRVNAGKRILDFAYRPIEGDDNKMLIIISDATEEVAHERAEREQRELVALFQRISVDRGGVEEFVTEAAGLVQALRTEQDAAVQMRLVHTLKGNCSIYGLETYAALAHEIESHLVETGETLSDEQRKQLVDVWKEAMSQVGRLLGGARSGVYEVDDSDVSLLLAKIKAGVGAEALLPMIERWKLDPITNRLDRLSGQIKAVAKRLGKPEPVVNIKGGRIRIDPHSWSQIFAALVHVVRNAVDHGIETPERRLELGKSEAGAITLTAAQLNGTLELTFEDDGAGIDFERLAEKAKAQGLPTDTHADLVAALFADGVSSKDSANDVSGRGVGMAAVRQVIVDSGGSIEVESKRDRGTTFKFTFDESRVSQRGKALTGISASLVPNGAMAG